MKFRKVSVIILLLVVLLMQTAETKKKRRRKPKVQPPPRTPAPTQPPTTRPAPRVNPAAPTIHFLDDVGTPPVAASACRRSCDSNAQLLQDQCICVCNQGYEYSSSTSSCEDIDECQDETNCIGGACTNSRGSYYCICPVGYNLHANGKHCLKEPRVIPCRGLVCLGEAELDRNSCRCSCQSDGLKYDYFQEKCLDIDECELGRHNCEQGCINTQAGFLCYCYRDFQLNSDEITCIPNPPLDPSNTECYGKCPGAGALNMLSCTCMCETGFTYSEADQLCTDRNECVEFRGWCLGTCENTLGSYTCTCPKGSELDMDDGWTCVESQPPTEELQCLEYEILCDHGNQCVQEGLICDGYNDCGDGSDEKECKPVCRPDQFSCANGRACLEASQRCNGENECQDHSDELDCPCQDEKNECHAWRNRGECESNPGWMNWNCRLSCKTCLENDGTESGVLEESEHPGLYFLRNSEDFSSTLQYTLRHPGTRGQASGSQWLCHEVTAVPPKVRAQFRLSFIYRKFTQAYNIPILGTERADEEAMRRACYTVRFLFADRRDLREAFYRAWGRVAVMDSGEVTVNIPEHSHLPELYNAVRGLGGTLHIPVVTAGAENQLCLERDANHGRDELVRTLAHSIRRMSVTGVITTFKPRLLGAYVHARNGGLWSGTGAVYTVDEYFARGVMSFFGVSTDVEVNTREKLERYDPALFNLVKEIFPCMNDLVDRCDEDQSTRDTQQIRINCNENGPEFEEDPDTMTQTVCRNLHHECPQWTEDGGCQNNALWMSNNCPRSCDTCPEPTEEPENDSAPSHCKDSDRRCPALAKDGRCQEDKEWMNKFCPRSCRTCGEKPVEVEVTTLADDYGDTSSSVECQDRHFLCKMNAEVGECATNGDWMRDFCPRSCGLCEDSPTDPVQTVEPCQDSDLICREIANERTCATDWIKSNCLQSCGLCDDTVDRPETGTEIPTRDENEVDDDEGAPCADSEEDCAVWAEAGECLNIPRYMELNCPLSCGHCLGPPTTTSSPDCRDQHSYCPNWVAEGDCDTNPDWMHEHCRASCGVCGQTQTEEQECSDGFPECAEWAGAGDCGTDRGWMEANCPASCGLCHGDDDSGPGPACADDHTHCPVWAGQGDCRASPSYMLLNCRASCGVCDDPDLPEAPREEDPDCLDNDPYCIYWAESGNCQSDRTWMETNCPVSCGACHTREPPATDGAPTGDDWFEPDCEDADPLCPGWAFYGGCDENPEWMLTNCAYSCNSCHYLEEEETEDELITTPWPATCRDRHELCHEWATTGGCSNIPDWMATHCPASCYLCTEDDGEPTTGPPPDEDLFSDYPSEVTASSSDEDSLLSEVSEWIVEEVDASDSWRESHYGDTVDDSLTSSDASEQSDSSSRDEGSPIFDDDSVDSIGTQSPVRATQSGVDPTGPTSTVAAATSEQVITSRGTTQARTSVTTSLDNGLEGSSVTPSTLKVPKVHDVTSPPTNKDTDEELLITSSGFGTPSTEIQATSRSLNSLIPDLDRRSSSPAVSEEATVPPSTEVANDYTTTKIAEAVTDLKATYRGTNEPPSDEEPPVGTAKQQSYPTTTRKQSVTSSSTSDLPVPLGSTTTVVTAISAEESTVHNADSSVGNAGLPTVTAEPDFDALATGGLPGLPTSPTVTVRLESRTPHGRTVSAGRSTVSPGIFTGAKTAQPRTTVRGLLQHLTHARPTGSSQPTKVITTANKVTSPLLADKGDESNSEVWTTAAQSSNPERTDCRDDDENCPIWAADGHCEANPSYMLTNCRAACNSCRNPHGEDPDDRSDLPSSPSSSLEADGEDESVLPQTGSPDEPTATAAECLDGDPYCPVWASHGSCSSNPSFMLHNCRLSCHRCNPGAPGPSTVAPATTTVTAPSSRCLDSSEYCSVWAASGGCQDNPGWMLPNCRKSCNLCEFIEEESTTARPRTSRQPDRTTTATKAPPSTVSAPSTASAPSTPSTPGARTDLPPRPPCVDSNDNCQSWAATGQCADNPSWMEAHCRKSCGTCQDSYVDCSDSYGGKCEGWASIGECEANPTWMKENCRKSCRTCNETYDGDLCKDYFEKCPKWEEEGECDYDLDWMRVNCKRSCGLCSKAQVEKECIDSYSNCTLWAEDGECDSNPVWMRINCCQACLEDEPSYCVDSDSRCTDLKKDGACDNDKEWMLVHCRMSCEACNISQYDMGKPGRCSDRMPGCAELAMDGECQADREWMLDNCCHSCALKQKETTPGCADLKKDCIKWAEAGECESNPDYMLFGCPDSCNVCSQCRDTDDSLCAELAGEGKCISSPDTMFAYCPKSCNLCTQ